MKASIQCSAWTKCQSPSRRRQQPNRRVRPLVAVTRPARSRAAYDAKMAINTKAHEWVVVRAIKFTQPCDPSGCRANSRAALQLETNRLPGTSERLRSSFLSLGFGGQGEMKTGAARRVVGSHRRPHVTSTIERLMESPIPCREAWCKNALKIWSPCCAGSPTQYR